MTNKFDKTIHVIVGPTASGKSSLAIKKAQAMDGFIINCDAMQSYDALHVLTAQPGAEEKNTVPHRLYGHLPPSTHYSAADWRNDAIREIETAWNDNKSAILCGGTGFYLKALMDGLSPIPEIPNTVREATIKLHGELGQEEFFTQLKTKDPLTASQLDPSNPQRTMRAWEVLDYTGKPIAEWQKEPLQGAPDGWQFHVTALFPNREKLITKMNKRIDQMIDMGILDEVKSLKTLIENGDVPNDALVTKALGFNAFNLYLDGKQTFDEAIEQTQIETRQYGKRQMTWLRNQISIDTIIEPM